MKEFLEDLEALLIKHPDIEVYASRDDEICIMKPLGHDVHLLLCTESAVLEVADIQRFKRELGAES